MKNFALFFQIGVLSTKMVSSRKWDFFTNSGRVPTGEKTRRNEENMPKRRRLSEVGHEFHFFIRKFQIFISFLREKGCNSTTRKPPLGGCAGCSL